MQGLILFPANVPLPRPLPSCRPCQWWWRVRRQTAPARPPLLAPSPLNRTRLMKTA